jgi:hypothetical protein
MPSGERDSDSSTSPLTMEMTEIRTILQYLIEMLEAMQAKPITLVTYAFINNTLSRNFDRYLSQVLKEACQGAAEGARSGVYDFERRNLLNLQSLDENEEPKSNAKKMNKEDSPDIKGALEDLLYPNRQTMSRFSINNPHARFSMNATDMRCTI